MKVLHIINGLGSGGAEKLVSEAIPLMNQQGKMKIDVLLLNDRKNVFDKKLKENGIKIFVVPLRRLRNPINIIYLRKYMRKGNYDIVHAHLFPSNYWASIASKLIFKSKPILIATEHNTHNKRRNKWYLRSIEKNIYSSFKKVISISSKTQENLIKWLNVKKKKINKYVVIENGIEINEFIDAIPYKKKQINNNFSEEVKLLCMVGRFSKQKDQATIIKAMEILPQNIHLLLIGEGELKEENENLAKKLGVHERVHFLGFRNDIPRILKTVDIIILSSHWEGFGLVAVEGMASGKPVIGSNVPGLNEVLGGAGISFEKGDSTELSEIIIHLLSNASEYNRVSQQCLVRANRFSINKMVVEYIKIYESFKDDKIV